MYRKCGWRTGGEGGTETFKSVGGRENWDFQKWREKGQKCKHVLQAHNKLGGSEGIALQEIFEILTIWDKFWYIFSQKGSFSNVLVLWYFFVWFWCVQEGVWGHSPWRDFCNSNSLRSLLVHFQTKRLLFLMCFYCDPFVCVFLMWASTCRAKGIWGAFSPRNLTFLKF